MAKRLRLIAGPNGSGKTTLTDELRTTYHVPLGEYTNPDEIEKTLTISDPLERSRQAQFISKQQRQDWLKHGVSHSYESVMSHESHLDYMREAKHTGFKTYLYYVCIKDPELNIDRVDERVKSGGHPVPEHKIIKRYHRSLAQLMDMCKLCRRVYFFDNSSLLESFAEVTPTGLLRISESQYNKCTPQWFNDSILLKWPKHKIRIIE